MKSKLLKNSVIVALCCGLLAGCGVTAPNQEETGETVQIEVGTDDTTAVSTDEVAEVPEEEPVAPEVYLKDVFAEHGMKVGTCLTPQMISSEGGKERIKNHFTSITCENAMKPDYIFDKTASVAAGELIVEFNKDMITMLDWAVANDIAVRGHTLVWYSQTPSWIFYEDFNTGKNLVSKDVMMKRMESMIKQVFEKLEASGYTDVIYAYDVVNEAWMENGNVRQDNNLWYQTMGEDFMYYAFYYADKYAPETIDLYYNDYNEQYKADTLVRFVDTLKDESGRYLIDGVGLQGHLYTNDDLDTYFKAIDKIAATGLKVQITELDVSLGSWQSVKPADENNLKKQGRFYYNLINGIFERVDNGILKSDALTFWGYCDSMSWRRNANPLLFDTLYRPKYAFYGAAQVKDFAGF